MMGFFDKLRDTVNTVAESVQVASGSVQGASDPLQDETIREYYEMIYGMKMSLGWYGNEDIDENSRARKYVEFLLGEACDDEKFKKAVELINLSRADYPKTKLEEQLKTFNKSLKEQKKYGCKMDIAYNLCYKELVAEFKSEYDMILDVIKDDANCKLFGQGIRKKIHEKYVERIGYGMTEDLTYVVISNSFFEGNPVTRKIVLEYLLDIYSNRVKNPKRFEDRVSQIEKMVLKALHFEKYGEDKTGYSSITDDDCREYVLQSKRYQKQLAEHPFEQEDYVKMYVKDIMEWSVFRKDCSSYNEEELFWLGRCDDYFVDAACNFAWKEIAKNYREHVNSSGENISESKNTADIVNMLYDYFSN